MAVTKGVGPDRVRAVLQAGHRLLGESRIQEAEEKIAELAEPGGDGPRWHLVGHLQSNKARRAVALFEAIHSVDSIDLAARLDRLAREVGRRLPVYLQVNVDLDPAKTGFIPDALRRDLDALLVLEGLEALGLMTVGALADEPGSARATFRALADLSRQLHSRDGRLGAGLSMGMTDDFEVAIEEGSTCVRVGRALFGERIADAPVR